MGSPSGGDHYRLPFLAEEAIIFSGKDGDTTNVVESPSYVLMVQVYDGKTRGFLKFDGHLVRVPVGLSFEFEGRRLFFGLSEKKKLKQVDMQGDDGTVYLDLVNTDLVQTVGRVVNKKWLAFFDSPFAILGVAQEGGVHPVLLIWTEEGKPSECFNFYLRGGQLNITSAKINEAGVGKDGLLELSRIMVEGEEDKDCGNKVSSVTLEDSPVDLEDPVAIANYLKRFVRGQDLALDQIAGAVVSYEIRRRAGSPPALTKPGILVHGPTGSGKTFTSRQIARLLRIPFVCIQASGKSAPGFTGGSLSQMFAELDVILKRIGEKKNPRPYAVIVIDEIDKLAAVPGSGTPRGDGTFNRQLQDELVPLLEGALTEQGFHTDNILFIAMGAFAMGPFGSLESIVKKALGVGQKPPIGFRLEDNATRDTGEVNWIEHVEPQDFISYGFIAEFVGRFPVVASFSPLSREVLIDILLNSEESPMKGLAFEFRMKGFALEIPREVIGVIVDRSPPEIGARGLIQTAWRMLRPIQKNPDKFVKNQGRIIEVTEEMARKLIGPLRKRKSRG